MAPDYPTYRAPPPSSQVKVKLGERCTLLMDAVERFCSKWQPDSAARTCTACDRTFGVTQRRHHCRYAAAAE
jgi:hypothetical protein